jgi:hypothetical protein
VIPDLSAEFFPTLSVLMADMEDFARITMLGRLSIFNGVPLGEGRSVLFGRLLAMPLEQTFSGADALRPPDRADGGSTR